MNVFEDLIEELKEENLIEETVIETSRAEQLAAENSQRRSSSQENASDNQVGNVKTVSADQQEDSKEEKTQTAKSPAPETIEAPEEPADEADFYRRRATEEVTSLKIVEHVISGVEREMMKIAPKSYDDLSVGIALHDFLQITADADSPEHSISEFKLMQETENWYSALSQRDKFVTVGDLRRYCETTRPVLSLQALLALARFYRNAPFSDVVRSKFEVVMTRLLTRELKNNKREMSFERDKLVKHISDLYEDWSSIPLYADDEESEVLISALKFEDFVIEIEEADSFEQLVTKDFFNRLRTFKDGTGENFFSPLLTATAIECNVAVGNRYVELIEAERENSNSEILGEKYQTLLDQTVSEATSKTLQLIKLLNGVKEEEDEIAEPEIEQETTLDVPVKPATKIAETGESKFVSLKINKWLLLTAILVFALVGGLYVWVEHFTESTAASVGVEKVDLENSALKEYFKAGRINENTFYGITQPAWKDLARETKEDVLRKTLADGATKGYSKIILLNGEGKTVGFASAQKGIELSGF